MSTFYLIRHASNDSLGHYMAGWTPGVSLNLEGRNEAQRLSWKLLGKGITRIYSSPLERALETAAPVARELGLIVEVRDGLGEVRYGEWTGKTMAELERDPRWERYLSFRSGARPPGGELLLETQARIVAELECLRDRHPRETVLIVSHGDPIRAALLYYAGIPIDLVNRIEVAPASISILELDESNARILKINEGLE